MLKNPVLGVCGFLCAKDFKTPTPKKVIIRPLSGGSYKTGGDAGLSNIMSWTPTLT
jgi:hypothetical protein